MATQNSLLPYTFEFDESSKQLYGVIFERPEGKTGPAISGLELQNHLREIGYNDFLISPVVLNNFLKNLKNRKAGRYTLGEKRDASVEVIVANDKLSASLKITKAWGGKPMTNAKIIQTIKASGIDQQCILLDALKKVSEHHHDDIEILFAKAKLPIAGKNASLMNLLKSKRKKPIETDSNITLDLHDIYHFSVVEPGQALIRKTPPTNGTDGSDVLGNTLPAQAGFDITLNTSLDGVEICRNDKNTLVATIKGHPVFLKNGVKVDPILTLESVDLHTGDIKYDGSVLVKNSVASGFSIDVSGDIHIGGQVEKATLKANGDISVGCGVLGEDEGDQLKAKLTSGGNINARFISLADIHCGKKLVVEEYILQSHVKANGDVLVGQEKGRGRIMGGVCRSAGSIKAKSLGSDAYVTTNLVLANEHPENSILNKLHREKERREYELSQIQIILHKVEAKTSASQVGSLQLNKLYKIKKTILALESQIQKIDMTIKQYENEKSMSKKNKVHASGVIYPNVSISIDRHIWHCNTETRNKTFYATHCKVMCVPFETK